MLFLKSLNNVSAFLVHSVTAEWMSFKLRDFLSSFPFYFYMTEGEYLKCSACTVALTKDQKVQ